MSWRVKHPSMLVERWSLQGNGDGGLGRYDGTPANMAGWPTSGPKNSLTSGEFNGNNSNINLGDVIELNVVSAFTICFWMAQDVIDATDILFNKWTDANHLVEMLTLSTGWFRFMLGDGLPSMGYFDYSTVISAATWHHIAGVFDGTQTGDANRMMLYVDGLPITLSFTANAIPAATADLSGIDMRIGETTSAFDGRLWDFRLYSVPLSRDEVLKIMHSPAPVGA